LGNNIEQTTNTYNINTCDKVSFKTCKAKLKQLRQALLRTPFNNHYCELSYYQKYFTYKLGFKSFFMAAKDFMHGCLIGTV